MKSKSGRKRSRKIKVFSSFEAENEAEYLRYAKMRPAQRLREFAVMQERVWGEEWTKKNMKKVASIERTPW